jgi:hypothetical protein
VGFFRRSEDDARVEEWTVGVTNHRVIVGGPERGIPAVAELRGYVASVTGGAERPQHDGRDSVAVLSAKMDLAELVNDECVAVLLTFEDLVARGLVRPEEVPEPPELPPVPLRGDHYDYIQAAHRRAEVRMAWLDRADAVLRGHGVALLPPLPKEDPALRPGRR